MTVQVKDEGFEILRVLCGSRAYGLEDPTSDFDYHGVFVVPTKRLLVLGERIKETSWVEGEEQDNTAWELRHFLNLAVRCNPTVLETFVAPVEEQHTSTVGHGLRNMLPYVLSRKRVYEAFRGYASNQRKKMFEPPAGVRAPDRMVKAATAYLRSLYHGIGILATGKFNSTLILNRELKERLIALKSEVPLNIPEVVRIAIELEHGLAAAYTHSELQEEPNMEAVNEFLLSVRRYFWGGERPASWNIVGAWLDECQRMDGPTYYERQMLKGEQTDSPPDHDVAAERLGECRGCPEGRP